MSAGSEANEPGVSARSGRGALALVEVNDLDATARRVGELACEADVSDTADVLRAALRPGDVCSRLGDGEFVLVMPDAGSAELHDASVRIRTALMSVSAGRESPLSVSMGTASWPADGDDPGLLIASARQALSKERRRQRRLASRAKQTPATRPALAVVRADRR